jgi:hypothetical protein
MRVGRLRIKAACRLHVLLIEVHPGGVAREMSVTRANELLDRTCQHSPATRNTDKENTKCDPARQTHPRKPAQATNRKLKPMVKDFFKFLLSIIVILIVALIVTFPATWLLMLFFGNIGMALSYWATLPLGILVAILLGAAGHNETWNILQVNAKDESADPVS